VAEDVVRAAGGVVCRTDGAASLEVLLVHRPRYDDWTFPKGKAERGESDEDCALREVEEETGWACELEAELPSTEYIDAKGRQKRVRYWRMRPVASRHFAPNAEIDEVRWLATIEAGDRLSYDRDRDVLRAATSPATM